ncbi:zinc transporter ZntB [Sphingomonas sp.]|uniref:zinc transporter ZntB n=1 Tax=Sphingomonas sp. TaxID=28214 RepID=UPI001B2A190C|nr:zinc transporter ZntB [Sphingomonas sp.]MBO9712909.1 zinc transporter ZntB [Sphingomonas sp.]
MAEYDASPENGYAGHPETGLIFARMLDGRGGARPIDWAHCAGWSPSTPGETLWLHIDRTARGVEPWLIADLGFSQATAEALTADETRPRAFREGDALVTVLRGVNFNPDAQPEDMITLRMWASNNRVLTLRRRPLQTPRDLLLQLERGHGPRTTGDLVTEMIEQLIAKIGGSILDMNAKIDELELRSDDMDAEEVLGVIANIRRNCLGLKRHMSPQHEALEQIGRNPPHWLSENNQRDIRETIDRLKRYLEDLDVSKESAIVLQDDINNRANARSNRTVYLLSVAAAIFLPISFVTSLLGVNVGGIPGTQEPMGFWILIAALVALVVAQLAIFRWLKWL